jgi:hypothetical protein
MVKSLELIIAEARQPPLVEFLDQPQHPPLANLSTTRAKVMEDLHLNGLLFLATIIQLD